MAPACPTAPAVARRRRIGGTDRNWRWLVDVVSSKDRTMPRYFGTQRGDRKRFPYEPRVIGGKLVMPVELQRIYQIVLAPTVTETVTDHMRAAVQTLWPYLVHKLPPA
jgi:hypothetical protein